MRDLNGLGMAADFDYVYTTGDSTPPNLLSISPGNGATDVSLESVVRIEFSEPIDPASIQSLTLKANGLPVAGVVNIPVKPCVDRLPYSPRKFSCNPIQIIQPRWQARFVISRVIRWSK